jgi:hypothetical protein
MHKAYQAQIKASPHRSRYEIMPPEAANRLAVARVKSSINPEKIAIFPETLGKIAS